MTKIEYVDRTWNPVTGCTPGLPCWERCWARILIEGRLRHLPRFKDGFLPIVHEDRFTEPHTWRKPSRVFVCSQGDLFNTAITIAVIDSIFAIAKVVKQHDYFFLTKRAKNMQTIIELLGLQLTDNIYLGVSAENQKFADERIPLLLETPAKKRWVSLEPLLGEVNISKYLIQPWICEYCYRQIPGSNNLPDDWITVWTSCICPECQKKIEKDGGINKVVGGAYAKITDPRCSKPINWVVVGCESGKDRRPCNIEWVRDIVHQCQHYKVPVFVKQLDIDGKVVRDINKFPEDLRIREYPK